MNSNNLIKIKQLFFKIITNTIAILIAAWILSSGIHITNIVTGIWVAIALVALNTFIRPLLMLITIPFSIVTFGFFIFAINAFIVMLAGSLVKGFTVDGFGWALGFSILVPIFRFFLEIPEHIKNGGIKINRINKVQEAEWEDVSEPNPKDDEEKKDEDERRLNP